MAKGKKTFWKPAAIGFGVMYLITMGVSTYMVKEKFAWEDGQRLKEGVISIVRRVKEKEYAMEEIGWEEGEQKDFYQFLVNQAIGDVDSEMMEISVAVYDSEKNLLAKSREQAGEGFMRQDSTMVRKNASFGLDDYLTMEEKETLAKYQWESICEFDLDLPDPFRFSVLVSPDGQDLWGIYVQKLTWKENPDEDEKRYMDPVTGSGHMQDSGVIIDYGTGEEISEGKTYYETDSEIVWQWMNPDVKEEQRKNGIISSKLIRFPYMGIYEKGSYERWKKWSLSPYLHGYPQKGEFVWEEGLEEPSMILDEDGLFYRGRYQLKIGMLEDPLVYMEVRMESRPWLAAMDYMKYAYAAGLILTIGCMAGVTQMFRKVYNQQAALEETRRDFINAIAHELKTPLGVIRNFAENLAEHHKEEKRDYYLAEMIDQTEEMDHLVTKMIELSKLDSEEQILNKESVSFSQLIKEEIKKFERMIKEKNLQICCEENGDFLVKGDEDYLAKAVWNLLSNAVEYNVDHGMVWIYIKKDECRIENTAHPLKEDSLIHAFDLFYTENKSRGGKNRHMGMGLYLAKKILGIHKINLTIENTSRGIQVSLKRQFS